jgi:hypothetical protein
VREKLLQVTGIGFGHDFGHVQHVLALAALQET